MIIPDEFLDDRYNQSQRSPTRKKIWTDEELMALPKDGHRYEIVDGKRVDIGSAGALHGNLAVTLSSALFAVVKAKKLGALFDSSTAFRMKNGARLV